jgi:hypothetical protein
VKQNYDILMTDSTTYDAHTPVQWTPDHVAKATDAKNMDAKTKAKSLESNAKGATAKESKEAKGWVGLPID